MKNIPFTAVSFGGFWKDRLELNEKVTIPAIYDRFSETGRFKALDCVPGAEPKPHIFWDSDVAKWIESAAYELMLKANSELEEKADRLIDSIAASQLDDGYYNCYYIPCELENRFTNRDNHELYCAGHLTEAAIAYYLATGKDKLLGVVKKYLDLIEKCFITEGTAKFATPGHEEIEIALIKLYNLTGEKKYLDMCRFFIDTRGTSPKDADTRSWCGPEYDQSHIPVREQDVAIGHSVRAVYLYSAMADLAALTGDKGLENACRKIFDNIINRQMYITGGIGSSSHGEAFASDYVLPNDVAYSETCASIGLAFFARRMLALDADSKYADTVERAMLNCVLAGVSLSGDSFFYVNPLEINRRRHGIKRKYYRYDENLLTQRIKVFSCSCCPPNLTRIIESYGDYLYGIDGDTVYAHQFAQSETVFDGMSIKQVTDYPFGGTVRFTVSGMKGKTFAVRCPGWCPFASVNGSEIDRAQLRKGYLYLPVTQDEEVFDFYFRTEPVLIASNPQIDGNNGRVCVMRGPLVYCAENILNGGIDLGTVSLAKELNAGTVRDEKTGMITLTVDAFEDEPSDELYFPVEKAAKKKIRLKMLPYYAYANSGESDMAVWMRLSD